MKVFDGNEFLKNATIELKLSNGKTFMVNELPHGIVKELDALPEDADETAILGILAKFLNIDPVELVGIGLIETKGALDFLFDNLLGSK